MAPETRIGERYATQVGELWSELARILTRLEHLAEVPERLADDDAIAELRVLQYRLHTASENAAGLSPPAASESAHGELADALASARDATGELASAVELEGPSAVPEQIHAWRGALFRVRLARVGLGGDTVASEPVSDDHGRHGVLGPGTALAFTIGGTIAFLFGATVGPLWVTAFGVLAICSSLIVYRP